MTCRTAGHHLGSAENIHSLAPLPSLRLGAPGITRGGRLVPEHPTSGTRRLPGGFTCLLEAITHADYNARQRRKRVASTRRAPIAPACHSSRPRTPVCNRCPCAGRCRSLTAVGARSLIDPTSPCRPATGARWRYVIDFPPLGAGRRPCLSHRRGKKRSRPRKDSRQADEAVEYLLEVVFR
jgi:hypothetical protein